MRSRQVSSNSIAQTITDYREQLILNKSGGTVTAYCYDVTKFMEFALERGVKKVSSLKKDLIIKYLGKCKAEGKSEATVHRYYMAIRSYCNYLWGVKLLKEDITQGIVAPMNRQKAPKVPTIEEVERLLEQPNIATLSGLRDRAILELLYSSALRASELCDLEFSDWQGSSVLVRCGKRGKTRTVPVNKEAQECVDRYLELFRGTEEGPLFATVAGKKIRRQLLCTIVREYAQEACIQRLTPHSLRHACATHLLDSGADLRLIQEVLGHSSIASTQRYTHLSSNKMQTMFQNFHPRKKQDGNRNSGEFE